ncbi:MAG: hypothetical protein CW341_06340 [Bacteroidetes bacterium]|nr:hypothetical protein [Bacteroidota bacterium]
MAKVTNLLDRIETIRAHSVTGEEYREFWGESLEKDVEDIMTFVSEFDAKMETEMLNQPAEPRQQLAADDETDSADNAEMKVVKSFHGIKKGTIYIMHIIKSEAFVQLNEQLIKVLSERIKKEETKKKKGRNQSQEQKLRFRFRKGLAKRRSKSLQFEELMERLSASRADYAQTGLLIMDFDTNFNEEERKELCKRINEAMPDGVLVEPIKTETVGTDIPIIEVEIVHRR